MSKFTAQGLPFSARAGLIFCWRNQPLDLGLKATTLAICISNGFSMFLQVVRRVHPFREHRARHGKLLLGSPAVALLCSWMSLKEYDRPTGSAKQTAADMCLFVDIMAAFGFTCLL